MSCRDNVLPPAPGYQLATSLYEESQEPETSPTMSTEGSLSFPSGSVFPLDGTEGVGCTLDKLSGLPLLSAVNCL